MELEMGTPIWYFFVHVGFLEAKIAGKRWR